MRALADLFTDDAQFVNVVGTWWRNRSEIEAAHAASHETVFRTSTLSAETSAVTPLAEGVAAVHARWTLTGQTMPGETDPVPRRGILLFVMVRHPDGWSIKVAQNTDVVEGRPVPPPAPSGRSR
jgi:uncharacterized protein (TIGR02246 family)